MLQKYWPFSWILFPWLGLSLSNSVSRICCLLIWTWVVHLSLTIFFSITGPRVVGNLFLEVIRAFYSYCRDALGSDLKLSYTQSGNSLIRYSFGSQLHTSSPSTLHSLAPNFTLYPCPHFTLWLPTSNSSLSTLHTLVPSFTPLPHPYFTLWFIASHFFSITWWHKSRFLTVYFFFPYCLL